MDTAWSKDHLKYRATNLVALLRRVNTISRIASYYIIKEKTIKSRAKVMSKFIDIAYELYTLKNYGSMAGIVAAFENSAIHRLKHTKARLSQTDLRVYTKQHTNPRNTQK